MYRCYEENFAGGTYMLVNYGIKSWRALRTFSWDLQRFELSMGGAMVNHLLLDRFAVAADCAERSISALICTN